MTVSNGKLLKWSTLSAITFHNSHQLPLSRFQAIRGTGSESTVGHWIVNRPKEALQLAREAHSASASLLVSKLKRHLSSRAFPAPPLTVPENQAFWRGSEARPRRPFVLKTGRRLSDGEPSELTTSLASKFSNVLLEGLYGLHCQRWRPYFQLLLVRRTSLNPISAGQLNSLD